MQNTPTLTKAIRTRRLQRGETVGKADYLAGVNPRTWAGWEHGSNIQGLRVKGLKKALGWDKLPASVTDPESDDALWIEYSDPSNPYWMPILNRTAGKGYATFMAIAASCLIDELDNDITRLERHKEGTTLEQLAVYAGSEDPDGGSETVPCLPRMYGDRYDLPFMRTLREHAKNLFAYIHAHPNDPHPAHSVADELILYMTVQAGDWMRPIPGLRDQISLGLTNGYTVKDLSEPLFDLYDDEDVYTFLYCTTKPLDPDEEYAFDHWFDDIFYTDTKEDRS